MRNLKKNSGKGLLFFWNMLQKNIFEIVGV